MFSALCYSQVEVNANYVRKNVISFLSIILNIRGGSFEYPQHILRKLDYALLSKDMVTVCVCVLVNSYLIRVDLGTG